MLQPTLALFLNFIRTSMAINTAVLPDSSVVIAQSYNTSLNLALRLLQRLRNADPDQPSIYSLAVYNLAGDFLVNNAQDIPPSTYFADLRKSMNITGFVGGVITSSNDESTGESLAAPDWTKNLTIGDLQTIKTPWGRAYMALVQQYGPSIWASS